MILSDVSVKRPVFATMIITAIVVFGLASYPSIGLDMLPNVDPPIATITTIYPGADPETVEKEVSEKIEEAVSNVSGIKNLQSISVENISQVIAEFEYEVDVAVAVQDVRDQISRTVPTLPSDVETPMVAKLDLGAAAVLTLAVSGPGTPAEVTRFARKRIKEPLQTVPGVGSIEIIGGQEREIKVWIDPGKLQSRGLTVTEVIGALAANNLDFPGGRLTTGDQEQSVKVRGRFQTVREIEDLKIMEVMGRAIRIRDVARIEDGLEERRSAARLNGASAVTVQVKKQSGTNAVEVADRLKARLDKLRADFPEGWQAVIAVDGTLFTRASFEHVKFDMIFGAFLAVIVVFIFLRNTRSTIIAAVAIPTSVIGTFTIINALGFTFNTLTMVALSLSIGILIDDAIVVLENIFRHVELGKSRKEAATFATGEIGLAVLATTLSIVAVFVPVAFMEGMIGNMFYEFGITVAVAVMISLFVAFTLTPMLCSRYLKESGDNLFYQAIEKVLNGMDAAYRKLIAAALRQRALTVGVALAAFAVSIWSAQKLEMEMITPADGAEFNVSVKMPVGTSLTKTERVAGKIAAQIREHEHLVVATVTSVGSDPQQKQNLGKVYVKMVDKGQRSVSQFTLMKQLREEFADFKEATIAVEEIGMMGHVAASAGVRMAQVQFGVRGNDLDELGRVTDAIVEELSNTPGFVDLDTTYDAGKPEVQVHIDRDRAANLGVVTVSVGQTINALVGGVDASKFRVDGDDYAIRVRLEEAMRKDGSQIANLKVRAASGKTVDLANIVDIESGTGPTQIDRSSRQRQVTILGGLEPWLPLGAAMDIALGVADRLKDPEMTAVLEGPSKNMKESFNSMFFALFLAVILIYMILASQFESFVHPFTIMMALPLSLPGAIGGLLLAKQALSIFAMIGMIMLMGLVTKNAILLIDYTNVLRRRDGMERDAALLEAGPVRLRPILMTTAAMVFGMLPVALSTGYGGETRAPMAVCVIGGLLVSTLLTLVVVPVIYALLDDLVGLFTKQKGGAA